MPHPDFSLPQMVQNDHFYFQWPLALLLLLLIPAFWFGYSLFLRHRIVGTALAFSYTEMARALQTPVALWRRLWFPVGLSLLIGLLILGLARPTVRTRVPVHSADVMMVLDISLSMLAKDIQPSRIEAAKAAAIDFIRSLPSDMRVGLEVFAGDNYVLSPPTRQHEDVVAYLQALQASDMKPRTELGSALRTALGLLKNVSAGKTESPSNKPDAAGENPSQPTPVQPASEDKAIVLLSDGDSHEGYPWEQAAKDARNAHVVIHTVGIGSLEGGTIAYQGMELPVSFDETALRTIAAIAGGRYFRVFKTDDFKNVYEQIQARTVHFEEQDLDLAFLCSALALTVLLGMLGLATRAGISS